MFDVFYYGKKPNAHPREQWVSSLSEARIKSTTSWFWIINEYCDYRNFDWDFDFDFLPDEETWTKDHDNVWPSQHQKDSGTWLCAKDFKGYTVYRTDVDPIIRLPSMDNWIVDDSVDKSKFDFSWHPDPTEPPFIYKWGCKYFPVETSHFIEYQTPEATHSKFMAETVELLTDYSKWNDSSYKNFDYAWRPNPKDIPKIYQFGTKINKNSGPRYEIPNAEFIEYVSMDVEIKKYMINATLEELVNDHQKEVFWATRKNINYEKFDFSWRPEEINGEWEKEYVCVFGSPESEETQTYFINASSYLQGNTAFKYIQEIELTEDVLYEMFEHPDMFFVDCYNEKASERFEQLKKRFPTVQKTRLVGSWIETIKRCITKSKTELFWILSSELDYETFDFHYYPTQWQKRFLHVFGSQWNRWSNTYLVNKDSFVTDSLHLKEIEHMPSINFVKNKHCMISENNHDVYFIDFGNTESSLVYEQVKEKANKIPTIIKYQGRYKETIQQIQSTKMVWVCSSICDYSNFDFTYVCDPFARNHLHVFPSGSQKHGDTFLFNPLHLPENIITFNQTQRVKRIPCPIITTGDTHTEFDYLTIPQGFPYSILKTNDCVIEPPEEISLWEENKSIIIQDTGATCITVPKQATIIKNEVYDYPYIIKASRLQTSKPLDIVFLSNNEPNAEENYQHLLNLTKNLPNKVLRVAGVNGRAQAYHAALNASTTPWAFTVFAKLKVHDEFDFSWQPDRLQEPKHYIFHARNPVNNLEYGHMGMIAYNKKLVLQNTGIGLDFTLDSPHAVVEILSGTACFNTDAYSSWRTAFREAIKLACNSDETSKYRLDVWKTTGHGDFAEWSIKGAIDACEYYDKVNGEFSKLKLSYEWKWLRDLHNEKYG